MSAQSADLIKAIREVAGDEGALEILRLIRNFDVWSIEGELPYPIPSAGPDHFEEVLDVLITEAAKLG